ncbi:helix-turn-helix transcriptional regulator [Bacillus sp. BRMEA1]|uniref:helix-turn-helix domain-containing protein n=1 Tax=Neobacillus endophyticus TaxID=2738405 RepID=UPI00156349A1|nr:helix-turn-helix transcriptional regulator [Neobacillus endophyticus]NRD81127.1 helix-turn-helix transcriptional regulator [Neobacillus endophyticus]
MRTMFGFGLGKKRTKLGKWLDQRGIAQSWLKEKTGLNKNTIGDLVNDSDRSPTQSTMKKILKALREIDPNVKSDDFWDM